MKKQITKPTKEKDIKREWFLVDIKDKILGHESSKIATLLLGKRKHYFVKNLDCGDYVIVINCGQVVVTGNKEKEKKYGTYSGYPGGLKQKALWQVRKENPTEIVRHAVAGMLPKNKLRSRLLLRLYLYAGSEHPYKNTIQKANT